MAAGLFLVCPAEVAPGQIARYVRLGTTMELPSGDSPGQYRIWDLLYFSDAETNYTEAYFWKRQLVEAGVKILPQKICTLWWPSASGKKSMSEYIPDKTSYFAKPSIQSVYGHSVYQLLWKIIQNLEVSDMALATSRAAYAILKFSVYHHMLAQGAIEFNSRPLFSSAQFGTQGLSWNTTFEQITKQAEYGTIEDHIKLGVLAREVRAVARLPDHNAKLDDVHKIYLNILRVWIDWGWPSNVLGLRGRFGSRIFLA